MLSKKNVPVFPSIQEECETDIFETTPQSSRPPSGSLKVANIWNTSRAPNEKSSKNNVTFGDVNAPVVEESGPRTDGSISVEPENKPRRDTAAENSKCAISYASNSKPTTANSKRNPFLSSKTNKTEGTQSNPNPTDNGMQLTPPVDFSSKANENVQSLAYQQSFQTLLSRIDEKDRALVKLYKNKSKLHAERVSCWLYRIHISYADSYVDLYV